MLAILALVAVVASACSKPAEKPAETPTQTPAPSTSQPTTPAPAATTPAATTPAAQSKSRLDIVKERGKLICGGNKNLPGFGFLATNGQWQGFDIDFCRAVAAAVFGDANKVEFRHLDAGPRFTALQSGEVDVLIRNTTWTLGRDTQNGAEFAPTTFYDGQAMMVRKNSGIKSLKDLNNKSVCVQSGTTTEGNLADVMRKLGVTYKPVVYATAPETSKAYDEERCDGFTTDASGLAGTRTTLAKPDDHVILPEMMSKEPLAPSTLNGDSKWFDVVKWVVFATFEAEELGITSKNVDQKVTEAKAGKDAVVRRFLGVEGDMGKNLGLNADWAAQVIKQVGNYGEIYDRNLGPSTPLRLERGLNALWSNGGLHYSPPFR